jgi:C4-dicarboxylate-specific signal transduction histidine kinase
MPRVEPNSPNSDNDSLVRAGSESLASALAALGRYIDKAAVVLDETEVSRAEGTANHLAALGGRVAQIVAELRKVEHHEQKAAGEVTPRMLTEYLRKLSPSDRASLVRDVQGMDKKGSVLG